MKLLIKSDKLSEGLFFTEIENKKYKTELISISFILPLTRENFAAASLLGRILPRGSERYTNLAEFNRAMDYAYDMSTSVKVIKLAETCAVTFNCDYLKNRFAYDDTDISVLALDIFFDMLLCPLGVKEGSFNKEFFESEKKKLIDENAAKINHKSGYARRRAIEKMCEGELFSAGEFTSSEDLENFDPESLFKFYRDMLSNAYAEAFFVGEKSEEFKKRFMRAFSPRPAGAVSLSCPKIIPESDKRIREYMDVTQSQLVLGYRSSLPYEDNRVAVLLFNTLFGASPTSRLFRVLREEHSLCYAVSSRFIPYKNILLVQSGLSGENIEKALGIINGQLSRVVKGEFDESELNDAKNYTVAAVRTVSERPSSVIAYYFPVGLGEPSLSPEEYADKIMSLTKEDIMRVAASMTPDMVYSLEPRAQ